MPEPYHPAALLRVLLRVCFREGVGHGQKERFQCEGDLRVAAAAHRTAGPGRAGPRRQEAASPSRGAPAYGGGQGSPPGWG